jgi:hypothetical protein
MNIFDTESRGTEDIAEDFDRISALRVIRLSNLPRVALTDHDAKNVLE